MRRVREAGVYCEILPWNADFERIRDFGAKAFILSGGPESGPMAQLPGHSLTCRVAIGPQGVYPSDAAGL